MSVRSYQVRTHGCQMNVHDSERLSGLLEEAGYVRAAEGEQPDVVVFNTCAVRENADNKLYGNLGHLAPVKKANPGMQIAVGGCLAQKDRGEITRRAPWVDVVFGTHNIGVAAGAARAGPAQRDGPGRDRRVAGGLPLHAADPARVAVRRLGLDQRRLQQHLHVLHRAVRCAAPRRTAGPGDVLAEVEALVAEGVLEVTLLGQNVNSYGVEFGDRLAFGKLLRACGEIDGLERVRFTSSAPEGLHRRRDRRDGRDAERHASLHMPLQSGSDRMLKAMRRSYRQERYLGIIDRVRAAMPDAAITTDIIVGFPGETEDDFAADAARGARGPVRRRLHLPVLQAPRHAGGRAARPAAEGRRAGALRAARSRCRRRSPGPRTAARSVGSSRCWSPRARAARTAPPTGCPVAHPTTGWCTSRSRRTLTAPRPGDVATVEVTYAAPHHLVADGSVRRRPPYPGRRRLAGPPGRYAGRRPACCSACRAVGAPVPAASVATCG